MGRLNDKSAGREAQLLELIDSVYAAATDPASWLGFLERFSRATDSAFAGVIVQDLSKSAGQIPCVWGLSEEAQRGYMEFAEKNVILQAAVPQMHTGAVICGAPLSRHEILNSEFYQDFLSRYSRVMDAAGACLYREASLTATLVAHRHIQKRDYGPREAQLIAALIPHLQRAVSIHRRLADADLERAATSDIIDRLAAGVIFLDERGRVVFENRAARKVLRDQDGLQGTSIGGIRAARSADDGQLQKLIAEACRTGAIGGTASGGALAAHRPSGRRPYGVIVAPLVLPSFALTAHRPVAVVFVTDPEGASESVATLREQFSLTAAEARVAGKLVRGERPADIAEQLQVTMPTVRTHVRRLIEKTDARSQADLVRILVFALAGLAGTSPSADDRASAPLVPDLES